MVSSTAERFIENPILIPQQIKPSREDMVVEGILNPGVFQFANKTWLLARIAERPVQEKGWVSFPVMDEQEGILVKRFQENKEELDLSDPRMVRVGDSFYLSTMSHLRLFCSEDGINFSEPEDLPSIIYPKGQLESFGIEDCRVSQISDRYLLTYTAVSESGVALGLMETKDWIHFDRKGVIIPPHNKDCAIFESQIGDLYYCLHRPSGIDIGGNYIWLAESRDLLNWGNHRCLVKTRPGHWDSARVGAGAAPIYTNEGWLEIYHGADHNHRYCLGALLLDIENPARIIARSDEPIMEPDFHYEQNGFFGNVIFTNGHVVNNDTVTIYYGASDTVICGAKMSISQILHSLK